MDVLSHNRRAWNAQVRSGNEWTVPVSSEQVARARAGDWQVVLTPQRPVPRAWFGELAGRRVLGLACGGGQQGPLFAAAGAAVTIFDNSPDQLGQDRLVGEREGLDLALVQGDMRNLSAFADGAFDLVFHPVSNCFVPDVRPVWREAHRVLVPGGVLLAGFANPVEYLFDHAAMTRGELVVRHRLPYSDLTSISEAERRSLFSEDDPLLFGHSLEDQIGGQTAAGFAITGFYEDAPPESASDPLVRYTPTYIATRAVRR